MAPADQPVHFLDRVHRSTTGAVAVGIVLEVRLEDRFQHELGGGLHHPIPDRRNAERSLASVRLRYGHPPHRIGPVRLRHHLLGPTHRRDAGCPRGKSCRRAGKSGRQAPPSPYDTAFSEGSGSLSVLPGSSPITFTSPSSKAHQKSGPFAPPVLPSLNAHTTLSDSRHDRRLSRR